MMKRLQSKVILLTLFFGLGWQGYAAAQSNRVTVSGTVMSEDDDSALPGATVMLEGTTIGTITDMDGHFTLKLPDANGQLIVSFVGYITETIPVNGQSTINVMLSPDITQLGEVVVVGYGEVKKKDATGSVTTIDSKSFSEGVVNSPQELLMGKSAGVIVTSNSGAPGNASTIRIRGGSSLNASNDPLIVIDGVPISNTGLGGSPNILASINPNDIATFSVLKDASATAIYGSRASNGVIIITTKRGGEKFKVNYSVTGTVFTVPKTVDVHNGDEFRALVNELYPDTPAVTDLLGEENTDWQDKIYQTAFGQDHSLNVSGTVKEMPYRVSLGYNNTDGILKTYNFERTTLSLGVDPSFFDGRLKANVNIKGMYNNNNFADQSAIGSAVAYDPTQKVFDGNTRWRGYRTWTTGGINGTSINLATANPVARLALTDNTSTVKRSIGNLKLDYALPFVENLHATLNMGYDYAETEGHNNVKDSTQWVYTPTVAGGRINPYEAESKNELLDFYLNYKKDLPSIDSKVDVMAGYSWSHFYTSGSDSTMNQMMEETTLVNTYETEYYLVSFFGRLNYTYKGKYLFTATLRDDATSRFAPDNRWGLFPAFALAWKINDEAFLQQNKTISELKLRIGYGVTGQQDINSNDYPYIATYTESDGAAMYPVGGTYYKTLRPDGYDENIKWESTTTINAGIDYGLFDNRITGSIDFYKKESDDLIAYIPVPVGTNFTSSLTTNVGSMRNKGFEFSINAEVVSNDNLSWTVGYNISYTENEITKLNLSDDEDFYIALGSVGGTTSGTIQAHKLGHPRSAFYVYQQIYDEEGHPIEDAYVDRNEDGIVNTSDMYIYKQPDPKVLMGINSQLTYKNWDFSFAGRASLGNYVYNNVAASSTYNTVYSSLGYLSNISTQAEKTQFTSALNTRFSDFYIENGSFFRMDNISIGYRMTDVFHAISNVRIGAGVQNAFVITNYTGLDPEVSGGLDNNFFPRTRSFFLSLNCDF